MEHAGLGEPFFVTPSDELLQQIMFDPANVRRKAWVVYVNYMILALVSADQQGDDKGPEAEQFRRNMRLALNDSSIFLEPDELNVQALTLLAVHGEDFASPNLSWMLLGHACRQAEALGLHEPAHADDGSRQRRLCNFWLLFAVDKSCSLAFGRSSFFPSARYRHVPLPDFEYLRKFQPHKEPTFGDQDPRYGTSTFGAHHFLTRIELSMLIGSILDLSIPGVPTVSKEELAAQLDAWYRRSHQVCNFFH